MNPFYLLPICYHLLPSVTADLKGGMCLTAEEYLGQIRVLDVQIQQDLEQLEELKVRAQGVTGIRYDKDKVQTSPSDRLCGDVCSIVMMNQKINEEIDRLYDAKQLIIGQIRGLRDADMIQILYKVYVQYKTLKVTGLEIGISYTTVLQKHREALALFEASYPLSDVY